MGERVARVAWARTAVGDDEVEELSPWHKFHDHVDVGRSVDDLVQADDVRMVEELEDFDLASDFLIHLQLPDPITIQDLHCHFVARELMLGDCVGVMPPVHTARG